MKLSDRKASVLRSKSVDELKEELVQLKKEQFNLRFQQANAELTNTARARFVRRKVATIKTLLAEKRNAAIKAA